MTTKAAKNAVIALCALCVVATGLSAVAASSHFSKYVNERWGFCIAYPSKWLPYEGLNKAGVSLTYPGDDYSADNIIIGALPNMESPSNPDKQMTLEEDAASALESIGDASGEAPSNVRVVSKEKIIFSGQQAIRVQVTYTQKGVSRVEETIFVIKDKALYAFELKCSLRNRGLYEAAFGSILKSFRWRCK
jgi:hypothetical protein